MDDRDLLLLKRAFLLEWLEGGMSQQFEDDARAELVFVEGQLFHRLPDEAKTSVIVNRARGELAGAVTPETLPLVERYLLGEGSPTSEYHLERSRRMLEWIVQNPNP